MVDQSGIQYIAAVDKACVVEDTLRMVDSTDVVVVGLGAWNKQDTAPQM